MTLGESDTALHSRCDPRRRALWIVAADDGDGGEGRALLLHRHRRFHLAEIPCARHQSEHDRFGRHVVAGAVKRQASNSHSIGLATGQGRRAANIDDVVFPVTQPHHEDALDAFLAARKEERLVAAGSEVSPLDGAAQCAARLSVDDRKVADQGLGGGGVSGRTRSGVSNRSSGESLTVTVGMLMK